MRASAWYRSCLLPSGMDTDPSAMPEQKAKAEADASSAISTSFLLSRSDCFQTVLTCVLRAHSPSSSNSAAISFFFIPVSLLAT